jgi:hypothetical protein
MPTNKELTTKNVPSVHWQADGKFSLNAWVAQLPITNY